MPTKKIKQPNGGALRFWVKGESGNPKGRPRKIITRIAQSVGVDFNATLNRADHFAILQAVLEFSPAELERVKEDPDAPAFLVIAAGAILKDIKNADTRTVTELYDRLFGKPRQVQELTGAEGGPIAYRDVKEAVQQFYTGDESGND